METEQPAIIAQLQGAIENLIKEVASLKDQVQQLTAAAQAAATGAESSAIELSTDKLTKDSVLTAGQVQKVIQELRNYVNQERKALTKSLDEAVKSLSEELHCDLNALNANCQMSFVKAGFVAMAADECSSEEKAKLFKTLKDKEQALLKGIVNPIRESESKRISKVELTKPKGSTLGLVINGFDGQTLLVEEVLDGLVMNYNQSKSLLLQVKPGDVITSVNDKSGDSRTMAQELFKEGKLTLMVTHEYMLSARPKVIE